LSGSRLRACPAVHSSKTGGCNTSSASGVTHAAAESGGYVYDLIVGLNGCDLEHCFCEWMPSCGLDRAENEVFQLGLVHNSRTLQPSGSPFAAALITSLLRFSVSACRQVLYFTNRLPLRTQEISAPAPTTTPKLPRSKSRKYPPPSPLSRAFLTAAYVLPLIGIFLS